MRKSEIIFLLFLFLLNTHNVLGQIVGKPFVESYAKDRYGYGTQNWDITGDHQGLVYIANNEGLLEYDGDTWKLFPLPNKTILRSLLMKDGKIYAGGQNEFGVYLPDSKIKWRFESLTHLIPEVHQGFEDVWSIENLGDAVYFRASSKIYILKGESCKVVDDFNFHYLGTSGGIIFVQNIEGNLFKLKQDDLIPLTQSDVLKNTEVRDIIQVNDGFLIATYKKGLFLYDGITIRKWNNQGESYIQDQYINRLDVLDNGDIVIGTGFSGVIIIDANGQYRYHINKKNGLPNNRVNGTFVDRFKNLWVSLDNGMSMIHTNSPFSKINPNEEIEEAGYDVALFRDKIYFGTNNGLFYTDWQPQMTSSNFNMVKNTNGQVYNIDIIDDRLILSHHEGAFLVENNSAKKIFDQCGSWLFEEDRFDKEFIVSGNFNGVSIFRRQTLEYLYDIPDINISSRFIEQDSDHNYWVSHPYLGVYRISNPYDSDRRKVEILGKDHGLPSNLQNHVFEINDEILICAKAGVYKWDNSTNSFLPYEPLNKIFGSEVKIRRLFEGSNKDIWFVTEKEVGFLQIEEKGLERMVTKKSFPEIKNMMNDGWEKIIAYHDEGVLITATQGFIHFDGRHDYGDIPKFEIVMDHMVINEDSIIYPVPETEELIFTHLQKNVLFSFRATEYIDNQEVMFQYLLQGQDEDWTPLSRLRTKEYNNLSPGQYHLHVRATNSRGITSEEFSLKFEISGPWYSSDMAIVCYVILSLIFAYLIYFRFRKKFSVMEQILDSTVKKSEEELLRLETEKIQSELNHKNRELVSATLHLVQKNETLLNIADKLHNIKINSKNPEFNRQLQKLINSLKTDDVLDQGWDQVMYHFNEVHENFFERLKSKYRSLTPKDLKMCAYLKINLSTKEIAALMNASVRGVEASRYRLRKKLNIDSDVNLNEFLMSL